MTLAQVNYINIGLMILSCTIAFFLPFELFLFSYAVLGPLHYLTEISWLHKRNYFSPGKSDYLLLGAAAVIIALPALFRLAYVPATHGQHYPPHTSVWAARLSVLSSIAVFVAFAMAAAFVLSRNMYARTIAIVLAVIVGVLFRSAYFVVILPALFIPTLIHVYVFTGIFILTGALRSRSVSGMLSLAVYVGCSIALFVIARHPVNNSSGYVLHSYDTGFRQLHHQLIAITGNGHTATDMYRTPIGIMLTRFIAFAYTYHYLNWFSKTSVIRWHKIPIRHLVTIIAIWLLAVALYIYDYRTGFAALYFLGMLHVVLEFPLNFQSFKDVAKHLRSKNAA